MRGKTDDFFPDSYLTEQVGHSKNEYRFIDSIEDVESMFVRDTAARKVLLYSVEYLNDFLLHRLTWKVFDTTALKKNLPSCPEAI